MLTNEFLIAAALVLSFLISAAFISRHFERRKAKREAESPEPTQ